MPLCNLWETSAPLNFCAFCVFCGNMQCCLVGAVETTAPPKDCHATIKCQETNWKMSWKIGWKITSFFWNLPAFIFLTCSTLHADWKIW